MEGAYLNRYVTDEQRSRRPVFNATLRAAASWLFFRVARSTRMNPDMALRSRLEKQPTDLRRHHHYMRDGALDKLQSLCGKEHHSDEDDAVFPSLDVGITVDSFLVANGDINNFKVLFVSAEKQVEIAERIEVPEVGTSPVDAFVVLAPERLGTTECILNRLSQKPGEGHTERLVRTKIGKLHCSLIHGV